MAYDVAVVRAQYPALADGRAWLDGSAGTQVPQVVIDAVAQTYRTGVSNQGAPFPTSFRGTEIVAQARCAVADLVGVADPRGVVFGPTMTARTYRFAAALSATWRAGDESWSLNPTTTRTSGRGCRRLAEPEPPCAPQQWIRAPRSYRRTACAACSAREPGWLL